MKIKRDIMKIFIFLIFLKLSFCQISDNFQGGTLESGGYSILDVADYLNISILVSSSGKIYNAAGLEVKLTTSANLNASSSIAVYNQNYILAACLSDSLLVKISLVDGGFQSLVPYSDFDSIQVSSKSSCSISFYNNIVFIGVSQPTSENKIKNAVIRLYLLEPENLDTGPSIDESKEKKIFNFPVEHTKTSTTRDISCEILLEKISSNHRFICAYENIDETNKIVTIVSINDNMNSFEKQITPIPKVPYEYGFKLYKMDDYYIRLVLRTGVYDLHLDDNFNIICQNVNTNLKNYNSYWNLFAYHNNIVIKFLTTFCYYNDGTNKQVSFMEIITIKLIYFL